MPPIHTDTEAPHSATQQPVADTPRRHSRPSIEPIEAQVPTHACTSRTNRTLAPLSLCTMLTLSAISLPPPQRPQPHSPQQRPASGHRWVPPAPAGARWLCLVSLAGLLVVAPAAQAAATGDTARLAAEALRFGSGYEARQKAITPPPEDSAAPANSTPTDTLPAPTGHASGQRTGAGSAQGNGRGNGGSQGGGSGGAGRGR